MTTVHFSPVHLAKVVMEEWGGECRELEPSDDAAFTLLFSRIAVALEQAYIAGAEGVPLEGETLLGALTTITDALHRAAGAFDLDEAYQAAEAAAAGEAADRVTPEGSEPTIDDYDTPLFTVTPLPLDEYPAIDDDDDDHGDEEYYDDEIEELLRLELEDAQAALDDLDYFDEYP